MILFILTVILIVGPTHSRNPTSVNLQMEASLIVEPEDMFRSTNILKDVQEFINKIVVALQHKFNGYMENIQDDVLSNFFKELVETLQNHDEDTLRGIARIMYFETRKFRESDLALSLSPKLKENLLKILQELAFFQPVQLKHVIEKLSKHNFTTDPVVNRFKVYFNETDKKYLDKIINKFETNDQRQLIKTIHNALKFIVFERYDKLPESEKRKLSKELNMFAEFLPTVKVYSGKEFKDFRKSIDVKDDIQMEKEDTSESVNVTAKNVDKEVLNDTNSQLKTLSIFY